MKHKAQKHQRETLAKKISKLAKNEPVNALALAKYGHDAESIARMRTDRAAGGLFTKNPRAIAEFIQRCLFIEAQRTIPALADPEAMGTQLNELLAVAGQMFFDRITAEDSDFFRDFSDLLDQAVEKRNAATGKPIDPVSARLLELKISRKTANLSEIAREFKVAVRTVWRANQRIGTKTSGPGRPSEK